MNNMEAVLNDIIEGQVDALIQDEAHYQCYATPLKNAKTARQIHRDQLVDFFKLSDLRSYFEKGQNLVFTLMPNFVSPENFAKIKNEMDHSIQHFIGYIISSPKENYANKEKPVLLQEMFGLSNETLLQIYDLAGDLVNKANYSDALSLYIFLTILAPHVQNYWIAQGVCFQALDRHQEAVAVFNCAKVINAANPAPYAYSVESYAILKEIDQVKVESDLLNKVILGLDPKEQVKWK